MRRLNYSELGILRLIIVLILLVSLTDTLSKPKQCTILQNGGLNNAR